MYSSYPRADICFNLDLKEKANTQGSVVFFKTLFYFLFIIFEVGTGWREPSRGLCSSVGNKESSLLKVLFLVVSGGTGRDPDSVQF